MKRIFFVLMLMGVASIGGAFCLGWIVGDPTLRSAQGRVGTHMLAGMCALLLNIMVHAIALTYFMGTGRWMEETTSAYRLSPQVYAESKKLKYRVVLAMTLCLLLLIVTGGFGAAADPASAAGFKGWGGIPAGTIHMLIALTTGCINLCVNLGEYLAISRNGELVEKILSEVRAIRISKGLEV